ncbi:hypothetical protein MN202_14455 [Rheinheimera muenzenbergensis]|uniref:Uncharacterized protein n=1 Tax=Rheinheimera muenzenbergensis TaxID=1193628 RepID=A0ABU8C9Z0_9GAMM
MSDTNFDSSSDGKSDGSSAGKSDASLMLAAGAGHMPAPPAVRLTRQPGTAALLIAARTAHSVIPSPLAIVFSSKRR